jgi:hypothetical protein
MGIPEEEARAVLDGLGIKPPEPGSMWDCGAQ